MDKKQPTLNLAMAQVEHGKDVIEGNQAATPPMEFLSKSSSSSLTDDGCHGNNRLAFPLYNKSDFPSYDGKKDPLPWLKQCEQYFWRHQTMEEEKMCLVRNHLIGTAQQWYYQLEREEGVPSWSRFSDYVTDQVLPSPQHVLCARLSRGKHYVLVHWDASTATDSWMPLDEFRSCYPLFQLEDELFFHEGRGLVDSYWGKKYSRRQFTRES